MPYLLAVCVCVCVCGEGGREGGREGWMDGYRVKSPFGVDDYLDDWQPSQNKAPVSRSARTHTHTPQASYQRGHMFSVLVLSARLPVSANVTPIH